jgi:two-component system cell cycle sensor histidine kinase/response regulator CckA
VAVVQDITALREAEKLQTKLLDQLQQAQKLEAVGTLAGGIAHDFNNLLMGIQGRASLMMSNMDFDHPHKEHIREIEEYVSSAADLTKQLLGFARGGKYEVKSIDFNQLVTSSSILFGRTKKEIRIHTRLEESLPSVEVDRRQIEQVLLNIYVNAWQAMPGGGDLYLETRCVALDDAYCTPHRVTPGRYVRLSITDNGIGMSDRIRHRIFEPFFTTKEKGRGTGLGLASAYGIIKNHGGFFTVYSEKGQGTTFNIFLPASAKEATQEMPLTGELRRGEGTVLLVDDEEIILDVGQALLQELGYTVIAAKSGAAAVNEVRRRGSEIDLVILDLIMPDMGGGKTFDRIREIMPDMVVLLSSGYSIAGKAEEIIRKGANGFIQKPFSLYELSEKVRSVLGD